MPQPRLLIGVTAVLPPAPRVLSRRFSLPSVPPPDSREGMALVVALIVGVVYVLLLVGINTPLADLDWLWVPLVLILGTIISFNIGSRLGSDEGHTRLVELELARTVAVHSGSGQVPEQNSPLGRVLQEYARAADESRRRSRVHVYAAGPAMWGGAFALCAAVLWGLGWTPGTDWLNYLAVVVEWPAIVLLFYAVTVLAFRIGWEGDVTHFAALTPRHWRRHNDHREAIDETIASLPWLKEAFAPSASPARPHSSAVASGSPWSEAPAH